MQGAVQGPVAAAVESVSDRVAGRGRDGIHSGQGGEGRLVADPAVVGPCGEALRGADGPEPFLLQQRRGLAGFDQLIELLLVGGELLIQLKDVLGQPHRFGAGDREGELFLPVPPPGDLGDLGAGELLAGIDPQVVAAYQGGQCVDGPGTVLAHRLPGGDRDLHALADPVIEARPAQLLQGQPQGGGGDLVGIHSIGLAHPAAGLGVHARSLSDGVAVGGHSPGVCDQL